MDNNLEKIARQYLEDHDVDPLLASLVLHDIKAEVEKNIYKKKVLRKKIISYIKIGTLGFVAGILFLFIMKNT